MIINPKDERKVLRGGCYSSRSLISVVKRAGISSLFRFRRDGFRVVMKDKNE